MEEAIHNPIEEMPKAESMGAEEKEKSTDASNRLRDEKGHFLPNPNKPCNHGRPRRKTKKQKDDENTVKIRIVKEEETAPGKDFEGRLADIKERTATNFIKSVCYHKPRAVSIDGLKYYSQDEVDGLKKSISDERASREDALTTITNYMLLYNKECLALDRVRHSLFIWRCIAIGALLGILSFGVTKAVGKYIDVRRNAQTLSAQVQEQPDNTTAK